MQQSTQVCCIVTCVPIVPLFGIKCGNFGLDPCCFALAIYRIYNCLTSFLSFILSSPSLMFQFQLSLFSWINLKDAKCIGCILPLSSFCNKNEMQNMLEASVSRENIAWGLDYVSMLCCLIKLPKCLVTLI